MSAPAPTLVQTVATWLVRRADAAKVRGKQQNKWAEWLNRRGR